MVEMRKRGGKIESVCMGCKVKKNGERMRLLIFPSKNEHASITRSKTSTANSGNADRRQPRARLSADSAARTASNAKTLMVSITKAGMPTFCNEQNGKV